MSRHGCHWEKGAASAGLAQPAVLLARRWGPVLAVAELPGRGNTAPEPPDTQVGEKFSLGGLSEVPARSPCRS